MRREWVGFTGYYFFIIINTTQSINDLLIHNIKVRICFYVEMFKNDEY